MPVTPTYPGVYVEEAPSGARTITGVATSITAFIGSARRGPVNEPKLIYNYGDYERVFGGLWLKSSMSFAVRDFFLNGGATALVVRVFHAETGETVRATLELPGGGATAMTLIADDPGAWGNNLQAVVDYTDIDAAATDLFNLTVTDAETGAVERYAELSSDAAHGRYAAKILNRESKLVEVDGAIAARPDANDDTTPQYTVADANKAADGSDVVLADYTGSAADKTGIYALEKADLFNLLCIPPYTFTDGTLNGDIDASLLGEAAAYCEKRRAMLLIDPPSAWTDKDAVKAGLGGITSSKNAAIFFPRIRQANPLRENQMETAAPSGAIAGVIARTDSNRGLWKAPAGIDATLVNAPGLSVSLTDPENGELNPLGVNCLRSKPPAGRVIWGSRTRKGADRLSSEWKYLSVRRMALYIEESLFRGSEWVVFEPNDEPLWAQIRLSLGSFMHGLFRQGAFQGSSPKEAYFVKCDKETTTQDDIDRGIVNILVGFAPLKPAEFVIIKLQQIAGQTA